MLYNFAAKKFNLVCIFVAYSKNVTKARFETKNRNFLAIYDKFI